VDVEQYDYKMTSTKLAFDLLLFLVVLAFVVASYQYEQGAGTFARVVGYPVLVLILPMLIFDCIKLRAVGRRGENGGVRRFRVEFPLIPLLVAALYAGLMVVFGYQLTTILFLTLVPAMITKKWRKLPVFLVISLAVTYLFVFLFRLGSGVALPSGALWGGW
jgi:hypothetical protein